MDSEDLPDFVDPGPGYLATLLEPLKIAASPDDFEEWVQEETNDDLDDLAPGYVFFFETGIRAFANGASQSSLLDFDEPYVVQKAEREMVDLNKIPESSEKLNFFRNIEEIQSNIRKKKEWSDINEVYSEVSVFIDISDHLVEVIDGNPQSELSQKQALEYGMQIQLVDRYTNTANFAPRGYGPTNLNYWISNGAREGALSGYTRTLQFVWSQILESDEYRDSILPKLHEANVWGHRHHDGIDNTSLQEFYGALKSEFLTPIDKEFEQISGGGLIEPDALFQSNTAVDEEIFGPLLSPVEPRMRSDLDSSEELDYVLFWSPAEWLGSGTFSKAPTFETTLWGLAKQFEQADLDIPIHIAQFKHPQTDGDGNRYSYAILQRLPPCGLGDPSGWLIFSEVGTDFSGSNAQLARIENCIDSVEEHWPIERREMTINLSEFRELMALRLVDDSLLTEVHAQAASEKLGNARGLLIEFIGYFVLSNRSDVEEVRWQVDPGGGELDLLAEGKDRHRAIECKADPESIRIEHEIRKLRSKGDSIDGAKTVSLEFMFWSDPNDRTRQQLQDADVEYTSLFDHEALNGKDLDKIEDVIEDAVFEDDCHSITGPVTRYPDIRDKLREALDIDDVSDKHGFMHE